MIGGYTRMSKRHTHRLVHCIRSLREHRLSATFDEPTLRRVVHATTLDVCQKASGLEVSAAVHQELHDAINTTIV